MYPSRTTFTVLELNLPSRTTFAISELIFTVLKFYRLGTTFTVLERTSLEKPPSGVPGSSSGGTTSDTVRILEALWL